MTKGHMCLQPDWLIRRWRTRPWTCPICQQMWVGHKVAPGFWFWRRYEMYLLDELDKCRQPTGVEMKNKEILTVEDLCEYLSVTKDWIYDQCQVRKLPFLRVGRHLRFYKKDIDKYLADSYQEALNI